MSAKVEMVHDPMQRLGMQKKIIHAGRGMLPDFVEGTKVKFHYKTRKCNEEQTVLDDSKKHDKPMEIIIGKKFKLECWETCLQTMCNGEVASFTVSATHAATYPLVAKNLRDIAHNKPVQERKHCCGMMQMADQGGTGYSDLNELLKSPQKLEFIFEVLDIQQPTEYKKESWTLNEKEKQAAVPKLKEEGNTLYKAKKTKEASEKYFEAISYLETLMLKEKPRDEIWNKLNEQKLVILLNFAQCKLVLNDFYPVIEHTSTVLESDKDNVKALYRRAKAHVGAWNPKEAREDFQRVLELDQTLTKTVQKELNELDEKQKVKDEEDKKKLGKLFSG
ncbi:unnamed protein product [Owenia fusiformis]|uniref:AIP/AIPL N-terminal FKBP-type PPIase domain-containing protein n=1 Tax=Owenia fusiformis TaxID=6347 RepID=A0A8J1UQZ9_OWEFU|nr:unnamed protein product [Owenia fusiformis]